MERQQKKAAEMSPLASSTASLTSLTTTTTPTTTTTTTTMDLAPLEASPVVLDTPLRTRFLQQDLADLATLPRTVDLVFPDTTALHQFHLLVKPDRGAYAGKRMRLAVEVPLGYRLEPPRVTSVGATTPFHPNIHPQTGAVSLTLLDAGRDGGWTSAHNLLAVVQALVNMFVEHPDLGAVANEEAADLYRSDPMAFETRVREQTLAR